MSRTLAYKQGQTRLMMNKATSNLLLMVNAGYIITIVAHKSYGSMLASKTIVGENYLAFIFIKLAAWSR